LSDRGFSDCGFESNSRFRFLYQEEILACQHLRFSSVNPHSEIRNQEGDNQMEFEFTGRHVEVTPAIERLAMKELKKLDRLLDSAPVRAHVIVSAEKHRKRAEIVVYWRDHVFTAVGENSDLSQSVASAAGRVEKQVLRVKEKFQTKKRSRTASKEIAPVPGGVIEAAPPAPRIIIARRYRVKPMTPEEAALELADSRDQFIVFRDAETNRVGVLYHRTDGNYGLIEP
jgi:putative sigma-54 modulation protein